MITFVLNRIHLAESLNNLIFNNGCASLYNLIFNNGCV